jgi:hypothetical protein
VVEDRQDDTIQEMADTLKATAVLIDSPLQVDELMDEYILITYDVPVTEEGNEARTEFLQRTRQIGAVQLSASVYYMPWVDGANEAALLLAEVKEAVVNVHYSKAGSDDQAFQMRTLYDMAITKWFVEAEERLRRGYQHLYDGKPGTTIRMTRVTLETAKNLKQVATRRGSQEMIDRAEKLYEDLGTLSVKAAIAKG